MHNPEFSMMAESLDGAKTRSYFLQCEREAKAAVARLALLTAERDRLLALLRSRTTNA